LNGSGYVIVTPDSVRGWAFYDDQQGVACADSNACRLVRGPGIIPAGSGSAELATAAASDGKALVLGDYLGVRLDHVTALTYSTYRQSSDAGNNLAIALQLNVDYDLNDQFAGYQGRLVFEPYQGVGGNVPDTTWQSWDARAGKWWGTRATVTVNDVARTNPCVQSAPCTWAELLAAFPNVGVHQTYGAIVLKAGSGWSSFRGNVDKLTIAVDSMTTTFDFDPTPVASGFRLRVVADNGVVFGTPISRDTVLPAGSTVSFAFSAAPGQGTLITVLDDTLAQAAGTITMDADHTLYAETEAPIVPSAAVVDLGQRLHALHYSSTPEQALTDFMNWYSAQADAAGPDRLAAQLDTARFLYVDPVADSAAIRRFEDAVVGTAFVADAYGPMYYLKPEWNGYAPGGATATRIGSASSGGSALKSISPSGSRLRSIRTARSRSLQQPGPRSRSASLLDNDEPDEQTAIMYVNGILTRELPTENDPASAATTTDRLRKLTFSNPRFGLGSNLRNNVSVMYVYNRSVLQDIEDYKRDHHCETQYERESPIKKPLHALLRFAQCKGVPFLMQVLASDLAEAIQQLSELSTHEVPIAEDARKVAYQMHGAHDLWQHAIMVGHSQGNLMIAQALEVLPSIDGHATNVGNACTAILTLASPAPRALFHGIESQYLRGLRVEGDILQLVAPSDFDVIHTPYGDSVAVMPEGLDRIRQRVEAHYVDKNYLAYRPSAERVSQELTTLSDECSAGSFSVTPASFSIVVRDTMRLGISLLSRTGRVLKGRTFGVDNVVSVNGKDSTVAGVAITTGPTSVAVLLDNTSKVQAAMSVKVDKRAMLTTIRWTEEPFYWGTIYNPGAGYPPGENPYPCGRVAELTDPSRTFTAFCRFRYTVTSQRADGGRFTTIYANPLDSHLGPPSHEGGGDSTQATRIMQYLTFEAAAAADTRFEVVANDAAGVIAIDTVGATFAGMVVSSNSLNSSGGILRTRVADRSADASSAVTRDSSTARARTLMASTPTSSTYRAGSRQQ
jgi:hypothetical protein